MGKLDSKIYQHPDSEPTTVTKNLTRVYEVFHRRTYTLHSHRRGIGAHSDETRKQAFWQKQNNELKSRQFRTFNIYLSHFVPQETFSCEHLFLH